MPRTYSDKEQQLKPTTLPDGVLLAIGKLVRAFAETEDLVNLHLCNLAETTESRIIVLLGKTAITRRLEMAEYLAQMAGEHVADLHKKVFNAGFREALECRNTVAHGLLLGETEDGSYAFLTSKAEVPTGKTAVQLAITYTAESIKEYARLAEDAVPLIEKHLRLGVLRRTRLGRPLHAHRKARPQRIPSAKKKPPPQS